MSEQLAPQPDLNFFKNIKAGKEVRLYLADQTIRSFQWSHERVERDLVYGGIQFEGYSRQFPVQAYLGFDGDQVRLACTVFVTDTGERVDLPTDTRLFLSPPLPSQHSQREYEDPKPPTYVHVKDREIGKLQSATSRLARAGLTPTYLFGQDVRSYYARNKLKGVIDFRVEAEPLHAAVMIRKYRRGTLLSPTNWSMRVTDYSNRSVQPDGWGKDGIMIFPIGTEIASMRGLRDVDEVIKALLEAADLLVSRNR